MASSGFVMERQKGGMVRGRMDVWEKRWIVHVHLPSDGKEEKEREKRGGVCVEYVEANEERVEIKREEKEKGEVKLDEMMEEVVHELEEKRGGKESIWRAREGGEKKQEGEEKKEGEEKVESSKKRSGLGEGLRRVFQCGMLHILGIAAISSEKDMTRRLKLFKKMVETKEEERDGLSEEEQEELSKFASWLDKEQKKKDDGGKGNGQGMLMGGAGSGGTGNGLSVVDKLVYLYYANPKILLHSNIKNVIVEKVVVVIRDLRETIKYKKERNRKKMAGELVSLEKAIEKEENVERVESMRRNYEEMKERAIKFWDQFPEWEVGVVIYLAEKRRVEKKEGEEKEEMVVVDHEFELMWHEIEDICDVGGQYYASRHSVSIPPLFWSL